MFENIRNNYRTKHVLKIDMSTCLVVLKPSAPELIEKLERLVTSSS